MSTFDRAGRCALMALVFLFCPWLAILAQDVPSSAGQVSALPTYGLSSPIDSSFPAPPPIDGLLQTPSAYLGAAMQVPPHHQETSSIASRYGVIPALLGGENVFQQVSPPKFPGAMKKEPPMWGTPNINVADPHNYPHITSLDVDDPESFFYWMRPNLFGERVEDEWDWLNMINTERPDFTDIT